MAPNLLDERTDLEAHLDSTEHSPLINDRHIMAVSRAQTNPLLMLRLTIILLLVICLALEIVINENSPLFVAHGFYTLLTLLWTLSIVLVSC